MFNLFKKEFLSWTDYKARMDFIEEFYWRQKVRRQEVTRL